ncbi:hypothetical protein ACP4OV_017153 [Aristida adscensionis]
MAEQAVFPVLERIGSVAVDEAIYLWGVSDKLESAKKQLLSMKAFLKDLDDKMLKGGAMARNLISEVREVAYEVEDIIDTANIMKRKSNPKISITGAIYKYVAFPTYLTHLHKLGKRIDSANARLNTIFENFDKFNIVATAIAEEPQAYIAEDDTIKHWRSVYPHFGKQIDVIGFEEQIENIKNDLLDKRNSHLTILSIIGPGGAGKSTMAKKVYELSAVKGHFEAHAWITVSQRFVPYDLLKEIAERLVPHDILEVMIKLIIELEKAELERFVPSDLIEEVLQRIMEKDKKAKKATMFRFISRSHMEERIKHAIQDWKADEVKHLLEQRIKQAIKDWEAEESEEAEEVKYLLEELIRLIMKEEDTEVEVKKVEAPKEENAKEAQVKKLDTLKEENTEEFEVTNEEDQKEENAEEVEVEKVIVLKEDKTEEAKVKYIQGLQKLVPRHLLEEVLQGIIEDEKAAQAKKANASIELDHLKGKIKHAMQDLKAKEAKPKYNLEELIKHALACCKAKEEDEEYKEIEVKYLLEELIRRSMQMEHRKAKLDELKQVQLMKLLHIFAQSGRYLIVLDDIWSTNAWDIIRAALPDKKNGSRVVFTTRKEVVAQHPESRKKIYRPKLLNEEESTQLLLSTALPEYMLDGSSNNTAAARKNLEELKELGKDLALKCCGLPLAIVVMGGHLSRRPEANEWKKLTSSTDWQAWIADDRIIGGILDLSYYDMPSNLRSCFLSTTAFPEDSSIDIGDLTSLWVAEGFIPLVRGQSRKAVAIEYVAELAQRCMIQVEKRAFSGRTRAIKVHDILRDWGIRRARREGLVKDCYNVEDLEASYSDEVMEAYRVVLHGKLARKADTSKRRLHTILDFKFSYTKVMANSLRTVCVLYIDSPGDVHLPKEIQLVSYLRYLGLGGKGCYFLPSSIGGLLNLETFHATGVVFRIPNSLWKIQTVNNVYASRVDSWSVPHISSKSKLEVMVALRTGTPRSTRDGVWTMKATKQQIIENKSPGISCCFVMCYHGAQLDVVGRCEGPQIPYYISEVRDLASARWLTIYCTNLLRNDQDILELGGLQRLWHLEIGKQSYTGPVITFRSGNFPRLAQLVLHDLGVVDWKLEHGSMAGLERLTLCKCPNLKHLPEGLLLLPNLRKLNLIAMPPSCYQEGTVAWQLKQKGCVVFVSSNEEDFKHMDVL